MNNILIAYYSLFKSTKNLALEIAVQTGGTLVVRKGFILFKNMEGDKYYDWTR
ncbi:hypothetical protein [Clostridium thailandense]|uniref:hypothetical protein n=1 Tax=Clostridium thailandense TaxID=2794346 RepID=UPI003988FDC2